MGDVAFTDSTMVWTDSTDGDSGMVHVRDLEPGEEHSFDPHSDERCNLLSFGATDERVVMGQYCGEYGPARDDRVQVLTTDGEQVVTLQDSSIDGGLSTGSDVVTVSSDEPGQAGTCVYDLETDRFLRLSDDYSQWAMGAAPSRTTSSCGPLRSTAGRARPSTSASSSTDLPRRDAAPRAARTRWRLRVTVRCGPRPPGQPAGRRPRRPPPASTWRA